MAVNKIDFPTGGAPTALQDYVDTLANIAGNITGKGYIPITNFGTTSTPQIAQSAIFSFGGVLYQADADTTISGSMAAESYIEMVPSGSPTGATLTPTWTATAPTWSIAYNHFVSASSNLVLNIMRNQDGYNSFIEGYDFIDVSANSTTPLSILGNLADMLKRHSAKNEWMMPTGMEGAQATISTVSQLRGCLLNVNSGTVATACAKAGADNLQTYQWDGDSYAALGNPYSIIWISNQDSICRLSSDSIALVDNSGARLRKMSFDGTDWAAVGNALTITGTVCDIEFLSENKIVMIEVTTPAIKTYEFDGADWSNTYSTTLGVTLGSNPSITSLSETRVVWTDPDNNTLYCYEFNGAAWASVGTPLTIDSGQARMSAINNNSIVLFDITNDNVKVYDWTGSTFIQNGNFCKTGLTLNSFNHYIAYLHGSDYVLFTDDGTDCHINYYRLGCALQTLEVYD